MQKSLPFLLFHFLVSISCALAGTITVVSNADSGPGTLRSAVSLAANGDMIDFALAMSDTIELATTIIVNKNLTILGPGTNALAIKAAPGNSSYLIENRENLTIKDIHFTRGEFGIRNRNILSLMDCEFSYFSTIGVVSGDFSDPTNIFIERCRFHNCSNTTLSCLANQMSVAEIQVSYSHFYDNYLTSSPNIVTLGSQSAGFIPGALDSSFCYGRFTHTTFSNNVVGDPANLTNRAIGGCLGTATYAVNSPMGSFNYAEINLEVDNSTFSGNTIGVPGGTRSPIGSAGVYVVDENSIPPTKTNVTISNSTFINNSKIGPGGWYRNDSSIVISNSVASGTQNLTLRNSVFAENFLIDTVNTTKSDVRFEFLTLIDSGYNFVGYSGTPLTHPTSQTGTLSNYLNPKVLPLGNYGGLTPTHGLVYCSPLIDAGDPNAPATDQRDSLRVGLPDIGAFEYQGSPAGTGPFTVVGTVLQSTGMPLAHSKIYFIGFQASDSSIFAIDSAITNASGAYTASVNAIDFYVKAAPDSATYPNEMPTYADTSLTFQGASMFCGSETVDFHTLAGGNPGGPGFIGGLLSQGANKKADPLGGITLFLYDPVTSKALDVTTSNDDGYFSFADVPLGDYEVWVDKPYIDNGIAPVLSLTAQNSVQDSLPFLLHSTYLELFTITVAGKITQSTGAPLSNTKVYMLKYQASDSSTYAVDSVVSNANGEYSFVAYAPDFYIKAAPDSATYPIEMPTYTDPSLTFQGARLILGSETLDFSTLEGGNPGGTAFMGGVLTRSSGSLPGGITLLLYDPATMKALDISVTNPDGYFSFADVPLGDYEVWVDKPFIDNGIAPVVSLTTQMAVQDSLAFILHSTYLELIPSTVGVEDRFGEIPHTIYPNPAEDRIIFQVDPIQGTYFQLALFDLVGKKVWESRIEKSISIDLVGFPAGIYTYRLWDADQRSAQGRVVVR